MDRPPSMRWIRRLVTVMQASHARDSQEWTRRIEGPPKSHPGRRS